MQQYNNGMLFIITHAVILYQGIAKGQVGKNELRQFPFSPHKPQSQNYYTMQHKCLVQEVSPPLSLSMLKITFIQAFVLTDSCDPSWRNAALYAGLRTKTLSSSDRDRKIYTSH